LGAASFVMPLGAYFGALGEWHADCADFADFMGEVTLSVQQWPILFSRLAHLVHCSGLSE
jgi:hypothetical protein